MLLAYQAGASLLVAVGTRFSLIEFLDKRRSGMASTFLTRLKVGSLLAIIVLPFVVYGATDPKAGACDTLYRITSDERLNHRCQVIPGVMAAECGEILTKFFQAQRRLGKK